MAHVITSPIFTAYVNIIGRRTTPNKPTREITISAPKLISMSGFC